MKLSNFKFLAMVFIVLFIGVFHFKFYLYMASDVFTYYVKCNLIDSCDKSDHFDEDKIYHAGGGLDNNTYTNSLNALNSNYAKNSRFFELDFTITNDSYLVVTHGYEQNELYSLENGKPFSHKQFMNVHRTDGLIQLDIDMLIDWMIHHKDAYIITDVKNGNINALNIIAKKSPALLSHFIVQIYKFREYPQAKKLGFGKVIYTNYISNYPMSVINWFYRSSGVSALTIPKAYVNESKFLDRKSYFFHTVNSCDELRTMKIHGAKGVYTDFISANCN